MMIDLQSQTSEQGKKIHRVGVKHVKHPAKVLTQNQIEQPVAAIFDMYVGLEANHRATHMSRFVEILNEQSWTLSIPALCEMLDIVLNRLSASTGYIAAQFDYFIEKKAPISQMTSLLDYKIEMFAEKTVKGSYAFLKLMIPVTTLCPCSKKISSYGAHNQRSLVTLTLNTLSNLVIEEFVRLVESKSSCELYTLLKRPDEKYVTEAAYDNPKFVEDIVRDIASALDSRQDINGYKIESENYESIHNHSAYAMIDELFK